MNYNNNADPGLSISESVNFAQVEEIMARAVNQGLPNNLLNNRALIDAGITGSSGINQINIVGES